MNLCLQLNDQDLRASRVSSLANLIEISTIVACDRFLFSFKIEAHLIVVLPKRGYFFLHRLTSQRYKFQFPHYLPTEKKKTKQNKTKKTCDSGTVKKLLWCLDTFRMFMV